MKEKNIEGIYSDKSKKAIKQTKFIFFLDKSFNCINAGLYQEDDVNKRMNNKISKISVDKERLGEVCQKHQHGEKLTFEEFKLMFQHKIIYVENLKKMPVSNDEFTELYLQYNRIQYYDDGKERGCLCDSRNGEKGGGRKKLHCIWGIHYDQVDKSKLSPEQMRFFLNAGFKEDEIGRKMPEDEI